jgi:hypothetical protein
MAFAEMTKPVRTDIAMIAARIIVFMIVLQDNSLVHTAPSPAALSADVAHFAAGEQMMSRIGDE